MNNDPTIDRAPPNRALAERLRTTLQAARGDLQVRARLRELLGKSGRLEALVREIGPNHAIVRDLLEVAGLSGPIGHAA